MILRQFFNKPLAQYSYLAGCPASGEAIIVDPDRDIERYIEAAEAEGLRITHITETHIHADYLSGSRELAARTGAHLYLPGQGGPDWTYGFSNPSGTTLLEDGDAIQVGGFNLVTWHTPGHTPEHVAYVVYENDKAPLGAFTGDFLFVGDVGRPDLLERAAGIAGTMEKGAHQLYGTIERFKSLPDSLIIWPAHGAGSACGKALGGVPVTTLGYEKITNWAFQCKSEDDFVEQVLSGQPSPPKYFAMMKKLNKIGPDMKSDRPSLTRGHSMSEFEQVVKEDTIVLDVRPSSEWHEGHIPGSLHIPVFNGMANWAGWLIPYDKDMVLIAKSEEDAKEAQRLMALIGLDRVVMWFGPELVMDFDKQGDLAITHTVLAREVPEDAQLLDVRGLGEWNDGHIPGALHVPLGELSDRVSEIPQDKPIYVHCQAGGRSPIASSVLERLGITAVDVTDGYRALSEIKEPVGV